MQIINRSLILIAVVVASLYGTPSKPHLYSTIPASANTFIDINPQPCNRACLERLLRQERIFSFMARYRPGKESRSMSDTYQRYATFFNTEMPQSDRIRIAILLPTDTIGRYAAMIANSVNAYLLYRQSPFEVKVYDSQDESYRNLSEALQAIEQDGFRHVIAAVTADGASMLDTLQSNLEIFIPTLNKEELPFFPRGNLYFGGIDYNHQLKVLSEYRSHALKETIIFDEPVPLSQRISEQAAVDYHMPPSRITISNPRINYTRLFEREGVEDNATLLLNTQPVRTSLILSQVTYNDINISSALSTQINFNPMILTLTQTHDVEKFFVASSIGRSQVQLREISALFQNDIQFNWVPYATAVLTNLIEQRQTGNYDALSHHFGLRLENNQIAYPVTIYQIRGNKFTPAPPAEELFGVRDEEALLQFLLQMPPIETP
jgi:SRSO17 transposase